MAATNKSTLSYANSHRPWQLFRDLFEALQWCQRAASSFNCLSNQAENSTGRRLTIS